MKRWFEYSPKVSLIAQSWMDRNVQCLTSIFFSSVPGPELSFIFLKEHHFLLLFPVLCRNYKHFLMIQWLLFELPSGWSLYTHLLQENQHGLLVLFLKIISKLYLGGMRSNSRGAWRNDELCFLPVAQTDLFLLCMSEPATNISLPTYEVVCNMSNGFQIRLDIHKLT